MPSIKQHRLSGSASSLPQIAYSWHGFKGDADMVGRTSDAAGASAKVHDDKKDCLLGTILHFRCLHLLAEFVAISFMEKRSLMLCSWPPLNCCECSEKR